MKKRKGWFKKARKKFVSKKVFSWKLFNRKEGYFHHEIQKINDGSSNMRYLDKGDCYQILKTIDEFSFVEGFWKAKKYAEDNSDIWCFYFKKNIKI